MPSEPYLSTGFAKNPASVCRGVLTRSCLLAVFLFALASASLAQTPAPGAVASKPKPAASHAAESPWHTLSPLQREALAPLKDIWSSLGESRKRKWLAIAATVPTLTEQDRRKLHSRMEEWASLSRADREAARKNFAQSKAVGLTPRTADWEAYQALSPQERKQLSASARLNTSGVAPRIKSNPEKKLIQVPLTRHTPPSVRSALAAQMAIDRNTLLPLPAVTPGASAPTRP